MSEYDDIINMPHHVSATRRPMSMDSRAAQFAPFAALDRHGEAISETARITGRAVELSEDEQCELSRVIVRAVDSGARVSVTYFIPDERKEGGRYHRVSGHIRRVDECERCIVMCDGGRIPLDAILSVS